MAACGPVWRSMRPNGTRLGLVATPPAMLQADRDYSGLWPRTTAPVRVRTWTLWVASGPAGAALEVQNAQNVLVIVELLLGDQPLFEATELGGGGCPGSGGFCAEWVTSAAEDARFERTLLRTAEGH